MMRKKAFTLIELLVVIAIISILAAILFPVFASSREKGRQTVCVSNVKQLATALMMYAQDYNENFPFGWNPNGTGNWCDPGQTWKQLSYPYIRDSGIFLCPSAKRIPSQKSDCSLAASKTVASVPIPITGTYGMNAFLVDHYTNGALTYSLSLAATESTTQVMLLAENNDGDWSVKPEQTANCANTPSNWYGTSVTGTAFFRHNKGAIWVYMDSHASWLPHDAVYMPTNGDNCYLWRPR